MNAEIESPGSEQTDPPPVTAAYRAAQRQFSLFSGLLLAWELIGVEFGTKPLDNLDIRIKSPDAAPYVLLVLIIYAGFRMQVEWSQCDARRRQVPWARADFFAAWVIAILAMALYAIQTILQRQVLSFIVVRLGVPMFIYGAATGVLGRLVHLRHKRRRSGRTSRTQYILFVIVFVLPGVIVLFGIRPLPDEYNTIPTSISVFGSWCVGVGLGAILFRRIGFFS